MAGRSALMETVRHAATPIGLDSGNGDVPKSLAPQFRYLRVQLNQGSPSLLVLGYLDPSPLGEVEVWYSANSEVIKLQSGRVVATQGLGLDWPAVRFPLAPPAWHELGVSGAVFEREHDELPSYRFGVRDRIVLEPVAFPLALALPVSLSEPVARRYSWYVERATQADGTVIQSWFALGRPGGLPAIVYSEQCLQPDYCLRMQRWAAQESDS